MLADGRSAKYKTRPPLHEKRRAVHWFPVQMVYVPVAPDSEGIQCDGIFRDCKAIHGFEVVYKTRDLRIEDEGKPILGALGGTEEIPRSV